MPLPPRNHRISIADAAAMTRKWREQSPKAAKAGAFHADQVRELLTQPGCVALRIYNGVNDAGETQLILVGVNDKDQDMTGGVLLEFTFLCPPFCSDGSQLNG
jgi:hypothetical protein